MNFMKAISTGKPTQYETVEDTKDLRIPVQSEEAFEHGITFKCKYIGTEEIPRPNSRVEIVAAMRRIRYEHKYRNIKKRKVFVDISADGIKVTLRKKKKKSNSSYDESTLFIMHYAINRVFYVSHDSQDLKILSYIARGEDGVFRCSVFKALKKSQAMHVVRTIGQAFEVCHKINIDREKVDTTPGEGTKTNDTKLELGEKSPEETDIDDVDGSDMDSPMISAETVELQRPVSTLVTDLDAVRDMKDLPPPLIPPIGHLESQHTNISATMQLPMLVNGELSKKTHGPFTLQQLQQLYHQQLLHQMHEADSARNELSRVRNQLKVEMDARSQAQNQVHRLLAQNRDLIVNIHKLMMKLQDNHATQFHEAIDETWLLSELSPNATVMSSAYSDSTAGLGTTNIDFNSSIFNNSNVNPSPKNPIMSSSTPNNKLFDGLTSNSHTSESISVSNNTASSTETRSKKNGTSNDSGLKETNPFSPLTSTNDMYQFAFDNTINTTKHSPGVDNNNMTEIPQATVS